jgi:6-pyruvoyltetrahydropterin/6-carboxytetrahydropterin synthase
MILGPRLDSAGLLADFTELRPAVRRVIGELHDRCLNEHPAFAEVNPSTEQVARYIYDRLVTQIPPGARLAKVRVWETSHCAAAYLAPDPPAT